MPTVLDMVQLGKLQPLWGRNLDPLCAGVCRSKRGPGMNAPMDTSNEMENEGEFCKQCARERKRSWGRAYSHQDGGGREKAAIPWY